MSYDVYLTAQTTDGVDVIVFEGNMTSNCAPAWRAAGCDLAEFDGLTGRELRPVARDAAQRLLIDSGKYRPLVLGGGEWGTVETAEHFLTAIANACSEHPSAIVRVSR